MRATMKKEKDSWTVYFDGRPVVIHESYQVAANIEFYLNHPELANISECAEVAARILGRRE